MPHGLLPWWAGWRPSVFMLVGIVAIGAAGYIVIEDSHPLDALYIETVSLRGFSFLR